MIFGRNLRQSKRPCGLGVVVVLVTVVADRQDQFLDVTQNATAEPVLSEIAEEALHGKKAQVLLQARMNSLDHTSMAAPIEAA